MTQPNLQVKGKQFHGVRYSFLLLLLNVILNVQKDEK